MLRSAQPCSASWVGGLAVLLAVASPRPAAAADRELRYDLGLDLTVTLTAAGAVAVSELGKDRLGPGACRLCSRDGERDTLNVIDREARRALVFRPSAQETAHVLSTVLAGALPAVALGTNIAAARADDSASKARVGADALVVSEAVMLSLAVNQLTKFVVARERPYAHFRSPEGRIRDGKTDDNLSFYSGHTALAFSSVGASATVLAMHGSKLAPLVLGAGLPLAALTGGLRIAADRHYLSDVLVGAAMGAAIGVFVPYLFHRPGADGGPASAPSSAPGSAPATFSLGGAF